MRLMKYAVVMCVANLLVMVASVEARDVSRTKTVSKACVAKVVTKSETARTRSVTKFR